MAKRRMLSREVTESDDFMDMPFSAQALYLHLSMAADDDGFIQPKRIIRQAGAKDDDLKILVAKKFAVPFESGVIVLRHWKANNYIQSDRYIPTIYVDEVNRLFLDTNNYYTLESNALYTKCIHPGYIGKDRVRLGKSKDKVLPIRERKEIDMSQEAIDKAIERIKF